MTRSHVEISVIVPFLNEEEYVEECVDALLEQDLASDRYELIFVDNHSTDASASIVSAHKTVTLLKQPSGNEYACRNTAARIATGQILAFTDADCAVESNWLSSILNSVHDRGADIVLGKRNFAHNASHMSGFMRDYENSKIEYLLRNQSYERLFAYTNNMSIKREVFDHLAGFSESIPLADTDFVLRYLQEYPLCKLHYSNNTVINHLEISSWTDWAKKLYSYGARSPDSEIGLNIALREQLRLFRYCFEKYNYNWPQRLLFVCSSLSAAISFLLPFLLHGGHAHLVKSKPKESSSG